MSAGLSGMWEEAARLDAARQPYALVAITAVRGSAPQDVGARMLVRPAGPHSGTVGGGKIEAAALQRARALLSERNLPQVHIEQVVWNLQTDIGMTCGGEVEVLWEVRNTRPWTVAVFGAGHIVQALMPVLLPLPVAVVCIDSRSDWMERLPRAANLTARTLCDPCSLVPDLPEDAFVLSITQGHATDLPVLQKAFDRGCFPFVGCIGSKVKARRLRSDLLDLGLPPERVERLCCPLGLPIGGNHPHEIAISIAAQLLEVRGLRA